MSIVVNKTRLPVTNWQTKSGAIVSIDDARQRLARSLKVNMLPQQDLHGYDHPWPAGGGKNLYTWCESVTDLGVTLTNNNGVITLNGTATRAFNFSVRHTIPAGTYTLSCEYTGTLPSTSAVRAQLYDVTGSVTIAAISNTAPSSASAQFTLSDDKTAEFRIRVENGHNYNNVVLYPQVESGSTKTAFAPYSNICPISGRTGVDVYDDPKYGGLINFNQFLKELSLSNPQNWNVVGGTGSVSDGVCNITLTSPIANLGSRLDGKTYFETHAGHKYYITLCVKTPKAISGMRMYYDSHSMVSKSVASTNTWVEVNNIVTPQKGYSTAYVQVFTGNNSSDGFAVGDVISFKNLMLFDLTAMFGAGNEPTTVEQFRALFPKDYYAYNSGTETCVSAVNEDPYRHIPITWQSEAGTVYGGTVDVTEGKMVIDRARVVYDGSDDEAWERHYSGSASAFAMKIRLVHAFIDSNSNIISNYLTSISSSAVWGNYDNWLSSSSGVTLNTGIKSITDVAMWRTYLASNPLEVCYELATPLTFHLTPQQIQMLVRDNTIWSDADSVEVEYAAIHSH